MTSRSRLFSLVARTLLVTSLYGCRADTNAAAGGALAPEPSRATRVEPAADPREELRARLGRPAVAAELRWEPALERDGLRLEVFHFRTEAAITVSALRVSRPAVAAERRPAVVVLHGTTQSKEAVLAVLERFARRGFVAVSFDARHHGAGVPKAVYTDAIFQAFMAPNRAYPYLYDTVYDTLRLLEQMRAWPEVDAERIGLIGISKGGSEALLAADLDPHVAAVAPLIAIQSFQWGIEHDAWQARIETLQPAFQRAAEARGVAAPDAGFAREFYSRVVPGLIGPFDGPALLPRLAPRPIFAVNSREDPRTPLPGVTASVEAARPAYRAKGAESCLAVVIQPVANHEVLPSTYDCLERWWSALFLSQEPSSEPWPASCPEACRRR